jgi:putative transposase
VKFSAQAHCVYKTRYHLVWITKYRRKTLVNGVDKYLDKVISSFVYDNYPDIKILEQSIQGDHIHMYVEIPPRYCVSQVIKSIKSYTSRQMRIKFEFLTKASQMWSNGYFVSTVGINDEVIKKYIQNQEKQDKGQAQLVFA